MNRQATDTIKGYFYQLDKSIIEILSTSNNNTKILVEGIEDVDIEEAENTIVIQCKNHEKIEYNHSKIKEPISLMLEHYSNNKDNRIRYHLYATFKKGQSKLPNVLGVEFFKKNFLTFKKDNIEIKKYEELNLSENDIINFINKLDININAPKYETQETKVKALLKSNINDCSDSNLELFFSKSLEIIRQIAIKDNENDRKITKAEFIKKLKVVSEIFDTWYIAKIGLEKYYKLLKKKYFSKMNISSNERVFLLECEENIQLSLLSEIVNKLILNWTNIQKRKGKDSYCPYIFLYNLSSEKLIELKTQLEKSICFIDGYSFEGAKFNIDSIIEQATFNNNVKIKFINHISNIDLILNKSSRLKEIYQFYVKEPFYHNEKHTHKIIMIKETKDILEII